MFSAFDWPRVLSPALLFSELPVFLGVWYLTAECGAASIRPGVCVCVRNYVKAPPHMATLHPRQN